MNTEEYVKKLEEENKELKEKLKTYTAPARRKTYYENHKEELIEMLDRKTTTTIMFSNYVFHLFIPKGTK